MPDSISLPAGRWRWLALAALLAEAGLFTSWRGRLGPYGSPIALFLCSLIACAAAYFYTRHRAWLPAAGPVARRPAGAAWGAVLLACAAGILLCEIRWRHLLLDFPVRIASSDVIPSISIYTRRLLAGETVYLPFTQELGYELYPTYLPAMWGPYLVPEWLRIDYRWMTGALLLLGIGGYQAEVLRLRRGAGLTFVLAALPFVLTFGVLRSEPAVVGHTVELMIVGYYLLLLAGVLLPSRWARLAGLLLCLMSRYSLVFWVPLYLGLLFFQKSKREAVLTVGVLVLGFVTLFVVPFLSHDWQLLSRAQDTYTSAALGEWQHLNDQGLPYHLYNGVGLGNLFYRFAPGDLLAKILLLKKVHVTLLLGVVGGAALLYWRQRQPRTDYRVFAALVLKLYLTVFYAFIQVPYYYLATTGIFASLFVVLILLGSRAVARPDSFSIATE